MKFTKNKEPTKTKVYEPYELTKPLRYTRKTIIYREIKASKKIYYDILRIKLDDIIR